MLGRIVEIAEDGRYLCLHRGFLVVQATGPAPRVRHQTL